jgi:hypothetical protein
MVSQQLFVCDLACHRLCSACTNAAGCATAFFAIHLGLFLNATILVVMNWASLAKFQRSTKVSEQPNQSTPRCWPRAPMAPAWCGSCLLSYCSPARMPQSWSITSGKPRATPTLHYRSTPIRAQLQRRQPVSQLLPARLRYMSMESTRDAPVSQQPIPKRRLSELSVY